MVDMSETPFKQRFVLDTSSFITESIRKEGQSQEEAIAHLLDLISRAKLYLDISCYMPPSIHDELTTMLRAREVDEEIHTQLSTWVIRKTPARHEEAIPAHLVHEFVTEVHDRVDSGLRVAEDAVREAGELEDEPLDEHEHKTAVDQVVTDLREKYRDTMRQGILDTPEDFDLVLLARELEAGIVTEDQGIIELGGDYGIRYMHGRDFPDLIETYLAAVGENQP